MKIKASSNKANVSALVGVFGVMAVVVAVLRSFQVFKLIDASTGFYKEPSLVTPVLYGVIAFSCFVFCAVSFLSRNSSAITTENLESKRLSICTYLFSFTMIYDCISSFLKSIALLGSDSMNASNGTFKYVLSSGSFTNLGKSVFALLSAVYFLNLASSIKNGSEKASERKILALAPIGWSCFRLVGLFITKISFLRVSDLFLELVMLCFMTLFFVALAQMTSGVYSTGVSWKIPACGFSASLVAAALCVSRLIATVVSKESFITAGHPFEITDLGFLIFAVMYVFEVTREYNLVFENDC